jgi:hypothetical protein
MSVVQSLVKDWGSHVYISKCSTFWAGLKARFGKTAQPHLLCLIALLKADVCEYVSTHIQHEGQICVLLERRMIVIYVHIMPAVFLWQHLMVANC